MLERAMPIFFAALLVGCQDVSPVGPNPPANAKAITPDCYEGCSDPDPDPEAPGYFIAGAMYQYDGCTETDYDADQDGLDDYCEIALANLFRPALSVYEYDQVGREPRFAAEKLPWGGVRIIYLLGYYYDVGNMSGSRNFCETAIASPLNWLTLGWLGEELETCRGHIGDSEWILLDLGFDSTSKHWVLEKATLSAHESTPTYYPGSAGYPTALSYPEKAGGYPLIWVADGKHANYPTQSACNAGGTIASDNCRSNRTVERLTFPPGGSGNIGSWAVKFVDCVGTTNTSHPALAVTGGATREECYFTGSSFRGWYGTGYSGSSDPYSTMLETWLTGGYW